MTIKDISFVGLILVCALFIHCDSCFSGCDQGPFFADLELKITVNDKNQQVPLEVYEGTYDDGTLIIQDTVSSAELIDGRAIYNLEAGFTYAAAAIYQEGAKKIIAIDGASMDLQQDDCDCDYPTNLTLNLRLAK